MSVHHIHRTHQDQLDNLTRKYLKTWFKILKNGVSDISIFHPYMLGMKSPSQVYKEADTGTYTMMRRKGDSVVNHVLDSRLERESGWKRKSSTVVEANTILKENVANHKITAPTNKSSTDKEVLINEAKREANKSIKEETLALWNKKVEKLTLQGDFANLLIEKKHPVMLDGEVFATTSQKECSHALKASINGLNTPDNLKRWGIRKLDKCNLCGYFANLEHVLNWCKTSLDQRRFDWRHDSIPNFMATEMKKRKPDEITLYIDIQGHKINGGTIPANIITTLH